MSHVPWHNVTKQYEADRKYLGELKEKGYRFETISSFKLALGDPDFVRNIGNDDAFTVKVLPRAERTYVLRSNDELSEYIYADDKPWTWDEKLQNRLNGILQDTRDKIKYEDSKHYESSKDYSDLKIVAAVLAPFIVVFIAITIGVLIRHIT